MTKQYCVKVFPVTEADCEQICEDIRRHVDDIERVEICIERTKDPMTKDELLETYQLIGDLFYSLLGKWTRKKYIDRTNRILEVLEHEILESELS